MNSAIIALIILFVVIILFITRIIPSPVTACLGCLLLVLTNVCSLSEAFSGFSNSIVILMFSMMIVGIAMSDTGAAKYIGEKVTQFSRNNERFFILLAGTTSAVLSTFLSNTAVIAIFLPMITSVNKSDKNMNIRRLTLPVTMGAMFGGVCTLVGSTPQLTANGILSKMNGIELKMFDYMPVGLILFAIYMLYSLTIGYKISKRMWKNEDAVEITESLDYEKTDEKQEIKINKNKVIIILIIFLLMITAFIGDWISSSLVAVIAAIACIITKCTSLKSIKKSMDWNVVFILAGCLGLASGITKSGAGQLMADIISKVISPETPAILVFSIFILLTMVISNFITNSTAVVIVLPIALAFCTSHGYNPLSFTLGIVYAANLTFSTPLANAQTAMTLIAGYKFSDYIKYTWFLDILIYLTIIIFVPLIIGL